MELEGIVEIRQFFEAEVIPKEYAKDEFFIRRGQHHNHIAFILEGGFRYLGYSSEGKEQIVGYSFINDFVVDYATFQAQKPAVIDAQAIKKVQFTHFPSISLIVILKIVESLISEVKSPKPYSTILAPGDCQCTATRPKNVIQN